MHKTLFDATSVNAIRVLLLACKDKAICAKVLVDNLGIYAARTSALGTIMIGATLGPALKLRIHPHNARLLRPGIVC
jgi:hypothetical protein